MKTAGLASILFLFALAGPAVARADSTTTMVNVGQVLSLPTILTAGDVVLCDQGVSCGATTPSTDIAGVGVFYLSFTGPYTPDVGPANTVTLLGGSQLDYFLTNYPGGFSPNAVFLDVAANGMATFENFVFDTSSSPTPTPEPSTIILLVGGLLGLGLLSRFRTAYHNA